MTSPGLESLIICDASPLILLAKASQAGLVLKLASEIWIPQVVWNEITVKSSAQREVPALMSLFSHCVKPSDDAMTAAFQTQVDAGEAAALALAASHPSALLLMDDRRGRAVAKLQGMRCIGTLGLLLRAKNSGFISAIRPVLDQLRASGMFLAPELESVTLRAAGE